MKIHDLATPCVLVNEPALRNNIKKYQDACRLHGKALWPMVKTHKCTKIVKMQEATGAGGFLCGTLDECEALADIGIRNIMYAYPVANQPALGRVLALAKRCNFYTRIDNYALAENLSKLAQQAGICINYVIIINSGLHRFGITPEEACAFANRLRALRGLTFCGISTHPGQVYGAASAEALPHYINEETHAITTAARALTAGGYALPIISSGSTPTFAGAVSDENINIFHPGNYVFNDAMQLAMGVAQEADCTLTVLTSIIANPAENIYIIDAGAKSLGLDRGAHGNTAIRGHGIIKNHPTCEIINLSEEVGKITGTTLRIGEKIEIIPNHACTCANLTSKLYFYDGDKVTSKVPVDAKDERLKD